MFIYEYEIEEVEFEGSYIGLIFDIEYNYTPGTPDVLHLPNGDPGYPGDPPEVELGNVYLTRVISEAHDRQPLKAEAKYWEECFHKVADDNYLMDQLYEQGPEVLQTEMDGYYIDRYEEDRLYD